MSRSGTLQDALKFVDEFHKAPAPSSVNVRRSGEEARGDDKSIHHDKDRRERSSSRHRREKSDKDGRKKGKRDKDKRRRSKVVNRDENDEEEDSVEDSLDEKEKRRQRRWRRSERKKDSREHRKKKERKSSSRRDERKSEKVGEHRRRREKEKQQHQRARELQSSENDSSASEDEDSDTCSKSSESEGDNSALRAEQVAADIVKEFPEVKDDLHQLLQLLDGGQAVDISGLPDKRLILYLQKLFKSLHLSKSSAGLYLLPSGAKPTVHRLGGLFKTRGKEANDGTTSSRPAEDDMQEKATAAPAEIGPANNSQPQRRRVIGPAMPSAEMLHAAAKLTEAEQALRNAELALENDPMIGPPPPSAVAEASSANEAERFEEVTRIMASDVGDAYDLLGLKQGVEAGALKKRYWKLSLLVHPDKCQHPQAHEAFMALNKAFKDLQDPLKRADIDRRAEEKLAKEEYEADLKARREAAQWRKLRGEEALPGDAQLLQGDTKDPGRDEWMTVLPPERQAGGPPSQQNAFFSRTEKSGRGDTSAWTDTPAEKAQKAKMQYLEAYNRQAALTGQEHQEAPFEKEKAEKAAALMDQYNQKKRSLSLVEEHQQKAAKQLKKTKKVKSSSCSSKPEEKTNAWAESHPWKPWDREKDLAAGRQAMKLDDKKTSKEALSARFGSSNSQRTFL